MKYPIAILCSAGVLVSCSSWLLAGEQTLPAKTAVTASVAPASAAIPTDIPATLGKLQAFIVQGDVQLIDQDGNTKPLTRGMGFTAEGSTIKVGSNGMALLVFSNGATLKVLANSTLKVTLFRQASFDEGAEGTFLRLSRDPSRSNIVLSLQAGKLQGEGKQPNTAAGSTFIVKTAKHAMVQMGGAELGFSGTIDFAANNSGKAPGETSFSFSLTAE